MRTSDVTARSSGTVLTRELDPVAVQPSDQSDVPLNRGPIGAVHVSHVLRLRAPSKVMRVPTLPVVARVQRQVPRRGRSGKSVQLKRDMRRVGLACAGPVVALEAGERPLRPARCGIAGSNAVPDECDHNFLPDGSGALLDRTQRPPRALVLVVHQAQSIRLGRAVAEVNGTGPLRRLAPRRHLPQGLQLLTGPLLTVVRAAQPFCFWSAIT